MGPYVSSIAPIIAVINSVIAVYVTQFKPDQYRAKITLLIVAIVLGVLASGATLISQYITVSQQNAEKTRRNEVRATLGGFIDTGSQVLSDLQNSTIDDDTAMKNADSWYNSVSEFLMTLGSDYRARFQSTAGFGAISPNGIASQKRVGYWVGVYWRVPRLEQFVTDFSR